MILIALPKQDFDVSYSTKEELKANREPNPLQGSLDEIVEKAEIGDSPDLLPFILA